MRIQHSKAICGLYLAAILLTTAACGWFSGNKNDEQTADAATPTAIVLPPMTPVATLSADAVQSLTTDPATAAHDFAPLIKVITQEMSLQQIPGLAVTVLHEGVPVFQQGFGLADVANKTPVTPTTLFRIGSITKPLTAIAIMQLAEAGKLNLDTPVVAYLPDFAVNSQITVRQLLSHSSGLGDNAIPYGRTDATALADYVKSLAPASAFAPPETLFSYSNTGYNVLGRIIEVVSGMSYTGYMTQQLFPALGMTHTTFNHADALRDGLALGYYPGPGAPQLVDQDPDNGAEYPSGFAFSNIEDLTRLALFFRNNGKVGDKQILSPASVQAMKTQVDGVPALDLGYGLGLLIRKRSGETTIGHNGAINGYAATLEMMPSKDTTVIVLSNRNNYDPERIVQAAFDFFVARPATPPVQPITLDNAAMASYAGHYLVANALPGQPPDVVVVSVQHGKLTATLPQVTFEMRALGNDVFDLYVPELPDPVARLAFVRDGSGAIQYMSFTMHALMKQQ